MIDLLIEVTSNKGRRIGDGPDERRGLLKERLPIVYVVIVGFLLPNNNASSGKGWNSHGGRRDSRNRGGKRLPLHNVRLGHYDLRARSG